MTPLNATPSNALVLNAAPFYQDEAFVTWLNHDNRKATWHPGGTPTEWSDVFVLVDPSLNGEGSDSDMPEPIWDQIVNACWDHFHPGNGWHIVVWLRNQEA